ncbi:hypothetical protein H8E88_16540 [candidate division KSB1 bacterium]|nr:hypothetical protein [candidate division KSB1 bacterium]
METIEFQAQAKNGIIKIPQKYKYISNAFLKIRLVQEKKQTDNRKKLKIKKLLQEIRTKDIFKNIENPSVWQRELRNECE